MKKQANIILFNSLAFIIILILLGGGIYNFIIKPHNMKLELIISNQLETILKQNVTINRLELKVEQFENNCRWARILEQILPPRCQLELDLMEEQIYQLSIKKRFN